MAKILADRDIKLIIGSVLLEANPELVNPNGIELRVGKAVHFHSTGEEKEFKQGEFLKVNPGESVSISSIEIIDFSFDATKKHFGSGILMGLITPPTTMMREGISQVSTKIDAGFKGNLNWGLRNGSIKDLILRYGEPMFKLTIFLLDKEESPDLPYGKRAKDSYQDSTGIMRSTRNIPADIPKSKVVSSSFNKIDPRKQLREAGYPFDHIGTELTTLHGKFEVVSTDVRMMKEEFNRRTTELSDKIESETSTLSKKIEDTPNNVLEKVESLFNRKFSMICGVIIGAIPLLYGGICYLQGTGLGGRTVAFIAMVCGILIIIGTHLITHRLK